MRGTKTRILAGQLNNMDWVHVRLAFGILLVCQSATISCSAVNWFIESYEECYVKLVPSNTQSAIMSIFQNEQNSEFGAMLADVIVSIACANREIVQQVVECSRSKAVVCFPDDVVPFVPKQEVVGKFLDTLCADYTNLKVGCVFDMSQNFYNCVSKNARELLGNGSQNASFADKVCATFQSAPCVVTEYRSCGCFTVKTFMTLSVELIYPPVCPAYTPPSVQCVANNPQLFTDNGGQQIVGLPVLFFALSVLTLLRW